MPSRSVRRLLVLAVAAPWLLSGCLATPASTQSESIAGLYIPFVVASAVVLGIVWGLLTWSIVRYRRRSGVGAEAETEPPQTRGNQSIEIVWTVLPALTVAVLFVLTVLTLMQIQPPPADPSVRLTVTGFQWGWRFDYPDEDVHIAGAGEPGPEIVLPVQEPIELTVTSADVIHSFYVPRFLVKYDAIPGRDYVAPLEITQPGIYGGQCAEFCGLLHSQMSFTIRAVDDAQYRAWLDAQRADTSGGTS